MKKPIIAAVLLIAAALGGMAWWQLRSPPLPAGLALSNGRIEATQIDVATKLAGRVENVSVSEGDFVDAGQIVARMNTDTLQAELQQSEGQLAQARNAVATASAVVEQRRSELSLAQSTFRRTEELVARGFLSPQRLDADRTQVLTAKAALVAAQSKVVETESGVQSAVAAAYRIKTELDDSALKAPRSGRVQYRLAEPGEVLPAGGKVVSILDLSDVFMTIFLPETAADKLAVGAQARLVLDAAPQYVVPATVSFVAAEAQFTPKTVETAQEREKLVFRVKARIAPELLRKYRTRVKAGMPGVAYVKVAPDAQWPQNLQVRLPPE